MRICTIEGCEKPEKARGWCNQHYGRWRRHGDPLAYLRKILTPEEKKEDQARRNAEFRSKNPDYGDRWRREHLDVMAAHSAKYRIRHPDKVRASEKKARLEHPERDRAKVHRRRARIKGSTFEKFTDLEIFDRDVWICGICDGPIDPQLKTGPWRVELDHIIPISKGGAHSRDNCQAAHARCNRMKSAKMPT